MDSLPDMVDITWLTQLCSNARAAGQVELTVHACIERRISTQQRGEQPGGSPGTTRLIHFSHDWYIALSLSQVLGSRVSLCCRASALAGSSKETGALVWGGTVDAVKTEISILRSDGRVLSHSWLRPVSSLAREPWEWRGTLRAGGECDGRGSKCESQHAT